MHCDDLIAFAYCQKDESEEMRRHGHRLATTRHHWHFWRRETPIGVRVRVACQSVDIVLR